MPGAGAEAGERDAAGGRFSVAGAGAEQGDATGGGVVWKEQE